MFKGSTHTQLKKTKTKPKQKTHTPNKHLGILGEKKKKPNSYYVTVENVNSSAYLCLV